MKNSLSIWAIALLLILSFGACSNQSSPAEGAGGEESLTGTLIEKPWSKSTQSYCAQGSAYFVLESGKQEYVLAYEESMLEDLQSHDGQKVTLTGAFETRNIEPSTEEISQHPVSLNPDGTTDDSFECTVFRVKKID